MKNNFSAVFALVVGLGMIAMWLFFIFTGNVPEIQTKPWDIAFVVMFGVILCLDVLSTVMLLRD